MRTNYTYRDLKNALSTFSDKQLDQNAICCGEDDLALRVEKVWIVEEDQINPSGDGMEPVSSYKDDPDFDLEQECVVCEKGTPVLILTSQ